MNAKIKGLKKGDRVRVTFEGTVRSIGGLDPAVITVDGAPSGTDRYYATEGELNEPGFQIERLWPRLRVGASVRSYDGSVGEVVFMQDGEYVVREDDGLQVYTSESDLAVMPEARAA